VNLGNYNLIKVEASIVVGIPVGVEDDARISALTAKAQVDLRKLLEETLQAQKKVYGATK
jgi:hypothetical protein